MAIVQALGLNGSLLIQFAIFAFAIVYLSYVVFVPYLAALQKREEQTKGGEELAVEILKQSDELKAQYETKARQISSEIKTIFDEHRDQANKEYNSILLKARAESTKQIELARAQVIAELVVATKEIKNEVSIVAGIISQKMLAK